MGKAKACQGNEARNVVAARVDEGLKSLIRAKTVDLALYIVLYNVSAIKEVVWRR